MSEAAVSDLARLRAALPQVGRVAWIGLRPGRGAEMVPVEAAEIALAGLVGDRARAGQRAVTLIQAEHLPAVAALVGLAEVPPEALRRNLLVAGINLAALRGRRFRVGSAVLEGTVPCHPCSQMERRLGPGGWNAMRGHGGLCARVLEPGAVALGDPVAVLPDP